MKILENFYPVEKNNLKLLFHDKSGSFFRVSDSLFTRIEEVKKNGSGELPDNIIAQLEEYAEKSFPRQKARRFKGMYRLRLEISNACNNRCLYCHVFKITKERSALSSMSYEDASRYIREYLELTDQYDLADAYYINFYGGEPLLVWPTLKKIITEYGVEHNGKSIVWGINTNGRLLSDDMMKFLKKYEVEIHMGCDGPKEVNDKVRRSETNEGTFDDIKRTLALANKHGVKKQLDSVISSANIDRLREIVDIAKENNVDVIYLDLLYKPGKLFNTSKTIDVYKDAVAYGKQQDVMVGGCCSGILDRVYEGQRYQSFDKYDFIRSIIVSVDGGIYPSISRSKPVTYGSIAEYFSENNRQWDDDYRDIYSYLTNICKDCFLDKFCYYSGIIQYQYHTKLEDGFEDSCNYIKEYVLREFIDESQFTE